MPMYGTTTKTSTYTVLDIRKTFEGCEADIRTIARRTGKWTMEYVDKLFYDILLLAENEYFRGKIYKILKNQIEADKYKDLAVKLYRDNKILFDDYTHHFNKVYFEEIEKL